MKRILMNSTLFLFLLCLSFEMSAQPMRITPQLNFPKHFIVWTTYNPTVPKTVYKAKVVVAKKAVNKPKAVVQPKLAVNDDGVKFKSVGRSIAVKDTITKDTTNKNVPELNRLYGNNKPLNNDSTNLSTSCRDSLNNLARLYEICKRFPINLNTPIINNYTFNSTTNNNDNTNVKPPLTLTQIKELKSDKFTGWVQVGGGIAIQSIAITTFVLCYQQPEIKNNIKVIDGKISIKQTVTYHSADNLKVSLITGAMALVGAALEISGGIQIHNANIGLGRAIYYF